MHQISREQLIQIINANIADVDFELPTAEDKLITHCAGQVWVWFKSEVTNEWEIVDI